MLTIGELARRSQLSPKALRLYDDLGLLPPAHVDPSSGYRYYHPDQVRTARLIGLLRAADMGLGEIGLLLADLDADPTATTERLARHLAELELQHTSRRFVVRHVHAVLREEAHPMFPIHTRHVPAQRVLSMQRRLRAPETDAFVAEARAAFAEHLGDRVACGPFTLVFHGIVDHESDGPIEAFLGCPDAVAPTDRIGIRTEPAHDEAFTTITKAQWDYPAILAAYDAVACSSEAVARPGSPLSCREVYLTLPEAVDDDELLCDVAFPLGEPATATG